MGEEIPKMAERARREERRSIVFPESYPFGKLNYSMSVLRLP